MKVRWRSAIAVLLITLVSVTNAAIQDGDPNENFVVLRSFPNTSEQLDMVKDLHDNMHSYNLDFWLTPHAIGQMADIMVRESGLPWLQKKMDKLSIRNFVSVENVQKLIMDREHKYKRMTQFSKRLNDEGGNRAKYGFGDYHSYDTIVAWMYDIERKYPQMAKVLDIGTTVENRTIKIIKLGTDISSTSRRVFWIDGGIHAREWAAVHTALYFIERLIADYNTDPQIRAYMDNLHFYVSPVLNPDGYEYSRSGVEPMIRLWRKNRAHMSCKKDRWFRERCCGGVDLNRNFDWFFGEIGSSTDRCSEIYQGDSAFSENESRAVRDMMFSPELKGKVDGFVTLHTYSQMFIHPFSHQRKTVPEDIQDIETVGRRAVSALEAVYGTKYRFGTGADILYPSSGGSDDWAKGKGGAKYVYLLELRPGDEVWDGFILDSRQLIPTGKETWAGVRVIIDAALDFARKNAPSSSTAPSTQTLDSSTITVSSTVGSEENKEITEALETSTSTVTLERTTSTVTLEPTTIEQIVENTESSSTTTDSTTTLSKTSTAGETEKTTSFIETLETKTEEPAIEEFTSADSLSIGEQDVTETSVAVNLESSTVTPLLELETTELSTILNLPSSTTSLDLSETAIVTLEPQNVTTEPLTTIAPKEETFFRGSTEKVETTTELGITNLDQDSSTTSEPESSTLSIIEFGALGASTPKTEVSTTEEVTIEPETRITEVRKPQRAGNSAPTSFRSDLATDDKDIFKNNPTFNIQITEPQRNTHRGHHQRKRKRPMVEDDEFESALFFLVAKARQRAESAESGSFEEDVQVTTTVTPIEREFQNDGFVTNVADEETSTVLEKEATTAFIEVSTELPDTTETVLGQATTTPTSTTLETLSLETTTLSKPQEAATAVQLLDQGAKMIKSEQESSSEESFPEATEKPKIVMGFRVKRPRTFDFGPVPPTPEPSTVNPDLDETTTELPVTRPRGPPRAPGHTPALFLIDIPGASAPSHTPEPGFIIPGGPTTIAPFLIPHIGDFVTVRGFRVRRPNRFRVVTAENTVFLAAPPQTPPTLQLRNTFAPTTRATTTATTTTRTTPTTTTATTTTTTRRTTTFSTTTTAAPTTTTTERVVFVPRQETQRPVVLVSSDSDRSGMVDRFHQQLTESQRAATQRNRRPMMRKFRGRMRVQTVNGGIQRTGGQVGGANQANQLRQEPRFSNSQSEVRNQGVSFNNANNGNNQQQFQQPCIDRSPWCGAWLQANPNVCQISSIYMSRDCARTCRFCN